MREAMAGPLLHVLALSCEPRERMQGRRTFELQLMPALTAFFEEGIAYYTPHEDPEAESRITHWEWSTVAVFTCAEVRAAFMAPPL